MKHNRFFAVWVCLILALLFAPFLSAKIYLVAVGISDYPGNDHDLNLPVKDAMTIYNVYRSNRGDNGIVADMLLNNKATRQNINSTMKRVFSKAGLNDIMIFFFSGHGYKGGFNAYDGALPYSDVRSAMAVSKCKNKMIFADACFSGKIRKNKKAHDSSRNSNVMLFLSSRDNEVSLERSNMNNGLFTTYLVKALSGEADYNSDRIVTARELFTFVSKGVAGASSDRQHPVMWGKFNSNMPVIRW